MNVLRCRTVLRNIATIVEIDPSRGHARYSRSFRESIEDGDNIVAGTGVDGQSRHIGRSSAKRNRVFAVGGGEGELAHRLKLGLHIDGFGLAEEASFSVRSNRTTIPPKVALPAARTAASTCV